MTPKPLENFRGEWHLPERGFTLHYAHFVTDDSRGLISLCGRELFPVRIEEVEDKPINSVRRCKFCQRLPDSTRIENYYE